MTERDTQAERDRLAGCLEDVHRRLTELTTEVEKALTEVGGTRSKKVVHFRDSKPWPPEF